MTGASYLAICLATWGLATFAMKVAGSRLDPMTVATYNMVGYLSVGVFLLPKAEFGLSRYHVVSVVIGALFVLGNMAFYKLSQTAHVSSLAPLTALNLAIPVLLGILLLGEPPTVRKALGIALALAALYFLSSAEEAI
jgi:uncharacterized membrane protein